MKREGEYEKMKRVRKRDEEGSFEEEEEEEASRSLRRRLSGLCDWVANGEATTVARTLSGLWGISGSGTWWDLGVSLTVNLALEGTYQLG